MTKFEVAFSEPLHDMWADTGFALDGSYSKEEAIELFKEAAEDYDSHFDEKEMGRGYARFYGNWTDDGEFKNMWWWDFWKSDKVGEQEVWLACVPQPKAKLNVQTERQ